MNDVPEFDINIDERGRVAFVYAAQAHAYLRRFAGKAMVGQFYEMRSRRSDRQSRALHAMVKPWLLCEARGGWSIEALKVYVLGETFGFHEYVHPTTGEVYRFPVEMHTSKLTVHQFAELMERAMELAAEDGVILIAPDEYLKAKEQERKRAARAALKRTA